ncbi:hypothetical protein HG535_0A07450 [Zygotorulaspora mrakii]|uniref:Protein kinase domain-containing protein n=1 Tax=Zygotorulaspora mrakii TaxID=42260 RepID=A0A7H9AX34_ZYGMR|nr:uncharacterized protein HG535_0A07450 [Zygotorulaspora mrakii]QLG70803.1 hypothetical protein HG535_0A07450 [Zygotorulaspora mrakii]
MPESDYFNLQYLDDENTFQSQKKSTARLRSSSTSSRVPPYGKSNGGPISPGIPSNSHLRSPNSTLNLIPNTSTSSSFRLPSRIPGGHTQQSQPQSGQQSQQLQQIQKSISAGSSAHSSRRASLSGASTTRQAPPPGSPSKHCRHEGTTGGKRHSSVTSDATVTTPTLVIPPELASLSTQSTSAVPTPQPNPTVQHHPSNNSSTNLVNSTVANAYQMDTISPSSSTKSSMNLGNGSTLSLRSYKKQYVLNEQVYLDKMKNSAPGDYYTRGIAPESTNDDNDELELEMDDIIDTNSKDDDDFDFGTNFFTASTDPDNLVAMSSKFLMHRLEWLRQTDPTNTVVEKVFQELDSRLCSKSNKDNELTITSLTTLSMDTQELLTQLSQHPLIVERFEWQTMLANVLRGDIVTSEKTKIAKQNKGSDIDTHFHDDIWLELKAYMSGKPVEKTVKQLNALRESTDGFFQEIIEFRLDDEVPADKAEDLIRPLLKKYYKVVNYWSNMKKMHQDKPITKTEEFITRIEALNSWINFKSNFEMHVSSLKRWVGNDELDLVNIYESKESDYGKFRSTGFFAEQVMKERDIETVFQRKIFFPLAPWVLETKLSFLRYEHTMKKLNLNLSSENLELLIMFPMRLLKEIIVVRLSYAQRLQNPTMMMIDQMIDDFSSYIRLSVQLKFTVTEYCKDWQFYVRIDPNFDNTVIDAIRYLFTLLHLKLLDCTKRSFKTFKEADELYKYWEKLKNVGHYIDGAGEIIAQKFNKLTLRLIHRLHSYLLQQQNSPPKLTNNTDLEKWLVQIFENLGSMKRKLNRFTNVLTKAFQNSVNYKVENHKLLLQNLKDTGHFLIFTGGDLEQEGIYLIGSAELLGCSDEEILKILYNSEIGCDMIPKLEIRNSLSLYNAVEKGWDPNTMIVQEVDSEGVCYYHIHSETSMNHNHLRDSNYGTENMDHIYREYRDTEQEIIDLEMKLHSLGYILVLSPGEPMLWEGDMYNLSDEKVIKAEEFRLKVNQNTLILLNQGSSYALEYQSDRFQQIAGDSVSFIERRCSFEQVENDLQRINKAYFRFTYSVLSNSPKFINNFQRTCPDNEALNSVFLFARDFGRNFLRTNVTTYDKKSLIILLMVKLSVSWISFLVSECDPNDQKTFRWCVPAMEFAMQMINGWNVLGLDEEQFSALKQKIAACMSLLISHFDVMGTRSGEADKITQQTRPAILIEDDMDDISTLQINSELRMLAIKELEQNTRRNPHQIGKVLDDTDKENKYLLSLASSMSNVSMRWKKRNFIGGGTFGSVYSAVNLDNGEILAVKEIKIQDSKTMEKFFPSIKEEMSVLEMLNHPNIVQYFGVEVHRDKVNIFMEYCEGGSLASLLEHGRIEDEMVTQVYTLELLEGLAYLHQSGVVHRDIKPENILLDYSGIIKYVDFGAARKIAKNGSDTVSASRTVASNESSSSNEKEPLGEPEGPAAQDMMGTPMYMAPESITGSSNKGRLGADDVWSLGCVVLEMITGRRPWAKLDNEWAIMYHVAAGHTPQLPNKDEVSAAGRKFLRRCLIQNASKRSSAVELLMDPWIVQIRDLAFGDVNPIKTEPLQELDEVS